MNPFFSRKPCRWDNDKQSHNKTPVIRRQKLLTCPECKGHDLYYETALITGYKYHCKDCDYIGAFVIEQELELDENGKVIERPTDNESD